MCSSKVPVPNSRIRNSEVLMATTSSPTSGLKSAASNNPVVNGPSVTTKRIIRKITPLDPKKLQQAGLDRKIAEALSKQKSQQSSRSSSSNSIRLSTTSNVLTSLPSTSYKVSSAREINSIASKPATSINKDSLTAKNTIITQKIKLPKITITGPEVLTAQEKQGLADLDPHQRLIHVKNLLNKKLLQKKNTDADDNAKTSNDNAQYSSDSATTSKHLKPPPLYCRPNYKLPTKQPNEKSHATQFFSVLKEPTVDLTPPMSVKSTKITTTPQKLPKDIARKLDFQMDTETKTPGPGNQNLIRCLNKNVNEIPKASIKARHSEQQHKRLPSNATQNYKQLQDGSGKVVTKQSYTIINKSQETQNVPTENIKQQKINYSNEIPKASIKTGLSQPQDTYSSFSYKQLKKSEHKLDFPEVSPLKIPFPTVNIPKETPLPAIDSFKKPYPLATSAYCDLQHKSGAQNSFVFTNYENAILDQQPSTSLVTSNLSTNTVTNASIANCLIVLENKILSQDEMIDLTELRLSTSKLDAPRFITPHKPIPEVVIKVENTDEYPVADVSTSTTKEIQTQNKEMSTERVVISNKQNKIIINAHKLKLPPEQLVALAKKIKEKSSVALPAVRKRNQHKVEDIRILNTIIANKKTPNTHNTYVVPHNIEMIAQTPKEVPDKVFIQNKQLNTDANNQDHNCQSKETQPVFKAIDNTNFVKIATSTPVGNNKQLYTTPYSCDKSQEVQLENSYNSTIFETAKDLTNLPDYRKSAVEIVDEPFETEDCFSAVDFITALSNTCSTTNDNSLELSADELNLNASCAVKLSPLCIKSYPPCQKASTPKIKTIVNDDLLNSTFESSKVPETIVTNESPKKCVNLKVANNRQTLEVFHNTIAREIEVKKSSENLSISDSIVKHIDVKSATKQPKLCLETKIFTKFDDSKLIDNVVYHMERSSETLINNLTKKENKLPAVKSTNSMAKMASEKSLDDANKSCHNTSQFVLEPLKKPKDIDITNIKVENDLNETSLILSTVKSNEKASNVFISTSETASSKLEGLLETVTTENNSPQKSLDIKKTNHAEKSYLKPQCNTLPENKNKITNKEPQNLIASKEVGSNQQNPLPAKTVGEAIGRSDFNKVCCDFMKDLEAETNSKQSSQNDIIPDRKPEDDVILVTLKPDKEVLKFNTNILAQETEASNSSEMSSNTTVRQRVSRFIKGKINLVQRNKTCQMPNKTLSRDKETEVKNAFEQKIDVENKVAEAFDEVVTKDNKLGEEHEIKNKANKCLVENEKEDFNVNQSSEIPQQITPDLSSKQTELAVASTCNVVRGIQNIATESAAGDERGEIYNLSETEMFSSQNSRAVKPKSSMQTSTNSQHHSNLLGKIFTTTLNTNTDKASTTVCISSQQLSKVQEKGFSENMNMSKVSKAKSLISDNVGIPKTPVKVSTSSRQLKSPPNKSRQQIKLDTQITHSSEVIPKQVIVGQQELQENITESTPNEPQVAISSKRCLESSQFQDNIHTAESYTNIGTEFEPSEVQISQNLETKSDNSLQGSKTNIAYETENLNQELETIFKTMKSAKISLIDIVKHSPTKAHESCPVTPSKKRSSLTSDILSDVQDIKTLSEQLRSSKKEKYEEKHKLKQSEQNVENLISKKASFINVKQVTKNLAKVDEQKCLESKNSRRSDSRTSENQTEALPPSASNRKRYSTRPLISHDDLEFLSENSEVQVKLSKSKHNEKYKESNIETIPLTSATLRRQHRLYSKPLESELTTCPQPTKRTRYYSQTSEANVTTTFDNLESKRNPLRNVKSLKTEESCRDSTQYSNVTTPTKQRKKLRKAVEDIRKSQKSYNDTDSDDDNHGYDCNIKDCEESNEFLGFEEFSNVSNFQNMQDVKESEHEVKTKHGTLKNWLTTGKAISPTSDKRADTKRLRRDEELPGSSFQYLQNWNLSSISNEETYVTDDTSPADEEETSQQNPINKKFKRSIKNMSDIQDEFMENKKILIDAVEHSFIKPRNLRTKAKTSGTDSDCHKPKSKKSRKANTTKLEGVCKNSACNKEKGRKHTMTAKNFEEVIANSGAESNCYEEMSSKRLKYQLNAEEVGTDSNRREAKDKANSTKRPNDRSELKLKNKTRNRVESHNLYPDYPKSKNSSRSKTKQRANDDKIENVDIPLQQVTKNKPKTSKNKSVKSGEKVKSAKFKTEVTDLPIQIKLSANANNSLKEIEANDNEKSIITIDKDECEISCRTPQNLSNKRKRGKPRRNSNQIQFTLSDQTAEINTSQIKEISGDAKTSLLQMSPKKPTISNSSEDGGAFPSTKKCSLKRKLKVDDSVSDSTRISIPQSETQDNENAMNSLKPIETAALETTKNEVSTPTVGKKRKSNTDSNFNPRLLLITKREQLDTDEIISQTKPGSGAIQCGLCLDRIGPEKWKLHLAEHYGVGWQVGEEKLHIENRSVVLNTILNYMKNSHSKGLICRMCKKVFRSALGVLTHIEACGAQPVRVICEFCKKDYAKTTLPIHMRSCYARTVLDQSPGENLDESNEEKEKIFSNSGRLKRHSTIKAENKLKALGAELENGADNVIIKKLEVNPKSRIRYVPPLQGDFSAKWSEDIKKLGHATCPKIRCTFTSNDIKELSGHLKNCKHIKSGYFCNFCRNKLFNSEKEAIEHVIKSHQHGRVRKKSDDSDCNLKTEDEQSSDDNDLSEGVDETESTDNGADEEDDFDEVCHTKKGRKRQQTKIPYSRNLNQSINQTSRKAVFDGRFTDLNKEVLKKWRSFLILNYSRELLYAEFTPQYSVINNPEFKNYLPTQTVSMKFNFKTKKNLTATVGVPEKNMEWSELKRYESISNKMNTCFFLGAPVRLCSWLPLPDHVNEQYLAIVYRQEMFKFIKFSYPKQHHNIILIMKITQNNKVPELSVHYGFVIRDGPVHHLSFLPSGGYDEPSNRLGLVAVATIHSDIKVYSLPINVEFASTQKGCSSNENITLIEVKPSFLLNLGIVDKREKKQNGLLNTQCLQICWSEYSGHQHVFASFSNGFLGIWDITNDSQQNLNRFVVDDITNYTVLNYIYIGEKRVKCFAVHYDTCGPRWLAVSGAYRKFVIYDIKNYMQPVIMKEEVNKNILLSMDWCPLWETVLYSYCDTIPNNGRCVVAINPTNVIFPQNKIDVMVCSVTQLHYTPVTNMCVTALSNGDIVFLDTKELHYENVLKKKFGERRMLYAMDIKQLNGAPLVRLTSGNTKNDITKAPNDWLMYDENYKDKYGLIFESLIKMEERDRKVYLSENRCPPVNMLPLMRINTLRCNVNLNGKNLIALGYENGFIRLVNFNKETIFCN